MIDFLALDNARELFMDLDWGEIVLFATIFSFVVAILLTARYVNRKYLSDDSEEETKKKSKRGRK